MDQQNIQYLIQNAIRDAIRNERERLANIIDESSYDAPGAVRVFATNMITKIRYQED